MTATEAAFTHAAFEWVAMAVGMQLYARAQHQALLELDRPRTGLLVAAAIGAGLGSKLVYLLHNPAHWADIQGNALATLAGHSIVGGLLGGWFGIEGAKPLLGIRHSTGDAFVRPILIGILIGRIGCLIAGRYDETSGVPSTLPWAVDFGDGIARHPTQAYDMLFAAVLLALLPRLEARFSANPGLVFKLVMCTYLGFRLIADELRPVPVEYLGRWSGVQLAAAIGLLVILPWTVWQARGRTA